MTPKHSAPFGIGYGRTNLDWNESYVGARNGAIGRAQRDSTRDAGVLTGLVVPRDEWPVRGSCAVPTTAPEDDARDWWDAFDEPAATPERLAVVRRICSQCPVLAECRNFGLNGSRETHVRPPSHGFFGGLTPEERKARRQGDDRPHEELVTDTPRATGTHGGPRRGAGWAATEAVVDAAREGTG